MIGLLSDLLGVFESIGDYILYAIESFINVFFEGIEGLLVAAVAILPKLPETITPPGYLEEINWFFPVGTVIAIATPLLSAYVIFLGVRWIFNKIGEL